MPKYESNKFEVSLHQNWEHQSLFQVNLIKWIWN